MLNKITNATYYLLSDDTKERPAIGLVCGDDYSLVIDAGNSSKHAQDFIKQMKVMNVPPVKYVVITHGHWDHFLGMNEFEDAIVIVNHLTDQVLHKWRNVSFHDDDLHKLVDAMMVSEKHLQIIADEIPRRESFNLKCPDLVFQESLKIDLGNKVCMLETITSTHTDDSTIVYVSDDNVLFLGDSAYGKTTRSLFHYKQDHLIPMIKEIQKYDAEYFLLGHESICDREEMNMYWNELLSTNQVTTSPSIDEATNSFISTFKREPNQHETIFLQAFVNDQILRKR